MSDRETPIHGNEPIQKNISISIEGMYESCDRRTLYVTIHNADDPHADSVPCYSGQHLCDAINQAFQLADFFGLEHPSVDHLISDKLFTKEVVESAVEDVVFLLDRRIELKHFMAEKKRKKNEQKSSNL